MRPSKGACAVISLASIFWAAPAAAKDWPSAGWFEIFQSDSGCGAFAEYSFDGRSDVKLMLAYYIRGDVVLKLTSTGWSSEDDTTYSDIKWHLNGNVYSGTSHGIVDDYIYKGFFSKFSDEFLDDFAAGSALLVQKGEVTTTHLNLYSSAKAVEILKQCTAHVATLDEAKRKREAQWDYIEEDPFKK